MTQFIDFLPILLFVGVYFGFGVLPATAALMAGVALQLVVYWLIRKPIGTELKLTFWISMVFGALTLYFRDETFIQWKPTIVNWLFAAVLIGAQRFGGKNLIKGMFGAQLTLPDAVWNRLNSGWALGFLLAGLLNLFVAYQFSMDVWVSYKLIGGFAITLTYLVITMTYLARGGYLEDQPGLEASLPAAGDGTDQAPLGLRAKLADRNLSTKGNQP
ncbi:MAG: inner membrane-spanning protein YciB [Pseudomonadota bacterium]